MTKLIRLDGRAASHPALTADIRRRKQERLARTSLSVIPALAVLEVPAISSPGWILSIPYVKSVQIFKCPSSIDPETNPDYMMSGAYSNTASSTIDATSGFATASYGESILNSGTPMSAILRPSETVMVYEVSDTYAKYGIRGPGAYYVPYAPDEFKRHLDGINLTFGDGHVKWLSLNSLLAQSGTTVSATACNLTSINEALPFCSKLWNPFRS
jgi:prepilin-type processing-associated H-X9-DG protein